MNEIPKVVFSLSGQLSSATTQALADARRQRAEKAASAAALSSWSNAEIARGDPASEIARLKQQPGKPILAHGGASFARGLIRHGLVDEFRLLVHPVALGRGLALFSDLDRPLDLKLASATAFDGGAVAHVYRPA
jgi:dihydrofolate reductase